jgi:hypothetical protein
MTGAGGTAPEHGRLDGLAKKTIGNCRVAWIVVTLRLKLDQSEAAGMRPMICCICTIDKTGVVTGKGGCCEPR